MILLSLRRWSIDRPQETKIQGVSELNLASVATYAAGVLAQSEDLDRFVEFGLTRGSVPTPVFRWKVSRYARRLDKVIPHSKAFESPTHTDFSLNEDEYKRIYAGGDQVAVTAYPLSDLKNPMLSSSIAEMSTGTWRVDHADYPPGHYLVLGRLLSNGDCMRPIRITVRGNEIPQLDFDTVLPEDMFNAALTLHSKPDRRRAWQLFIDQLGKNPAHPGWEKLNESLDASKTLPITTFEAVASFVRNPDAVVTMAILRPEENWIWGKLEQLPFLWSLVPVSAWINGAFRIDRLVRHKLQLAGFDNTSIDDEVKKRIHLFASAVPTRLRGMAGVLACLYFAKFPIELRDFALLNDNNPIETRDRERGRLIAQHDRFDTRSSWPKNILVIPSLVRENLKSIVGLEIDDGHPNQWDVLNAPAITAICCLFDLPASDELVRVLQRLRGVDPDWFEVANAAAMQMIVDHRLNADPDCFVKEQKD